MFFVLFFPICDSQHLYVLPIYIWPLYKGNQKLICESSFPKRSTSIPDHLTEISIRHTYWYTNKLLRPLIIYYWITTTFMIDSDLKYKGRGRIRTHFGPFWFSRSNLIESYIWWKIMSSRSFSYEIWGVLVTL